MITLGKFGFKMKSKYVIIISDHNKFFRYVNDIVHCKTALATTCSSYAIIRLHQDRKP